MVVCKFEACLRVVVLKWSSVHLQDAGVGKSCLVLRFVSDTFTDYLENTIG